MIERVHILVTVRKPGLYPAADLIFQTLRVGFPTAAVTVQANGCRPEILARLADRCEEVKAHLVTGMPPTQHDYWLGRLVEVSHEPFWICDTDMVFFDSMEGLNLPALAGEYQPTFLEEFTGTIHVDRLHSALLWIRPVAVRDAIRQYCSKCPDPPAVQPERVLIHQTYIPTPNGTLFYDTAAGLYHAIGGKHFDQPVLARFEHLQCATYVDLIQPKLEDAPGLADLHQRVYSDPQAAKGIRAQQQAYYARRAAKLKS